MPGTPPRLPHVPPLDAWTVDDVGTDPLVELIDEDLATGRLTCADLDAFNALQDSGIDTLAARKVAARFEQLERRCHLRVVRVPEASA